MKVLKLLESIEGRQAQKTTILSVSFATIDCYEILSWSFGRGSLGQALTWSLSHGMCVCFAGWLRTLWACETVLIFMAWFVTALLTSIVSCARSASAYFFIRSYRPCTLQTMTTMNGREFHCVASKICFANKISQQGSGGLIKELCPFKNTQQQKQQLCLWFSSPTS